MASMTRRRTLVNPGRKRRKNLSLKQLLHFGTKRQRAGAAVRLKRKNAGKRKGTKLIKSWGQKARAKRWTRKRRRKNVGTILSVIPNGRRSRKRRIVRRKNRTTVRIYNKRKRRVNKSMARTRKRRRTSHAAPVRRRRRRRAAVVNPRRRRRRVYNRRRRRNVSYVGRIKRGMYKYSNPRRRRSRVGNRRRHYSRRRNPGMLSGGAGKIIGFIGGGAITAILSKFIPAGLSSGFMGYITKGIVAVLQGKVVGKMSGSRALGQDFMYGGLAYVALGVLGDMFGVQLPGFGLRGMGLIAPSSFYVPQVNAPGSMGSFIRPAAVPAPYVPPAGGMGNVRRGGRVR